MDLNKPEKLTFRVDHFLGATPPILGWALLAVYVILFAIKPSAEVLTIKVDGPASALTASQNDA